MSKSAGRGVWPLRDHPTTLWLTLALLVVAVGRGLPASEWLLVHLVLLGAVTHAAMVWSTHFAQALLKTPPTLDGRRTQGRRLGLLFVGTALVLVGVPSGVWAVTLAGAVCAAGAVTWHGIQLWRRLRKALPGRFRITLRYYLAAAACMPVGATFGVLLARHPADPWHSRLLVAHSLTMVLGWLGLTMTGTLVTLWPTMLRTRMDDRAEALARQALPTLVGALAITVGGALVDVRWLTSAGLMSYAAGLAWWARALVGPARQRPPRHFATVSVACALGWFLTALVGLAIAVLVLPDWSELGERYGIVGTVLALGFGLQLVTGALSYLVPSVLGGGPATVRASSVWFDRGAATRLVVVNLGLAICLLPVTATARTVVGALVVAALACFLPLSVLAIRESIRGRRAAAAAVATVATGDVLTTVRPSRAAVQIPSIWSVTRVVAAVSALALALSLGVALQPSAAGAGAGGAGPVAAPPTGHTTTVAVTAAGMRFSPSSITLQAGDRLVIELTNADDETSHDLVLDSGRRTPPSRPGGLGPARRRCGRWRPRRLVLCRRPPRHGHGLDDCRCAPRELARGCRR